MKKGLLLFLILGFAGILSACGEAQIVQKVADSEEAEKVKTEVNDLEKTADTEQPLSDEDIQRILPDLYNNLVDRIKEVGNEQGWVKDSNPPDYDLLKASIGAYVTEEFAESQLKPMMDDLFCQCDAMVFPYPHFDKRFKVVEKSANTFKVRSMQVQDEMGSGGYHIFFTVDKVKETWKLDSFSVIGYFDKPLNITQEEAEKIIKDYDPFAEFIKQVDLEVHVEFDTKNEEYISAPVASYLFYLAEQNIIYGIASNSGELVFEIPEEVIPQTLLDQINNEQDTY